MAAQLTVMQRTFALEYIICKNGTEAARRAGYKGDDNVLAVTASENLRKHKIAEFINERFAEVSMRADEVIARTSEIASGDMGDFIDIKHGIPFFALDKAAARNKLHLIKKFENTSKGVKLELYDAQAAQRTLAQHHGLLKSDIQITVNIELIQRTIEAIEKSGLNASDIFNNLIAELDSANVGAKSDSADGRAEA